MSTTQSTSMVRRPRMPLAAPDPTALIADFPGLTVKVSPNPAFVGETVKILPQSDEPLEGCEWRWLVGQDNFGPWQPVERPALVTILKAGQAIPVLFQVRRASAESPAIAARIEARHEVQGWTGLGEPLSLALVDEGRTLAVGCRDGVLYRDLQGDTAEVLRTSRHADQTLVTPDGNAVTVETVFAMEPEGQPGFTPEIRLHHRHSSRILARLVPKPGERVGDLTPAGEVILHGAGPASAPGRGNTAYTRLVNLMNGDGVAQYDGTLVAVAGTLGAVITPSQNTVVFLRDYRNAGPESVLCTYPLPTNRPDPRILLSPSGAWACLPVWQSISGTNRTVPNYEFVETATGLKVGVLDYKRVERFAGETSVWVSDYLERQISRCLKQVAWRSGRIMTTLPVYALAHSLNLTMDQWAERWYFAGDPALPDYIVGLCRGRVFYFRSSEGFGRLHFVPQLRPDTGNVVATSMNVYYVQPDRLQCHEMATGKPNGAVSREPRKRLGNGRRKNYTSSTGSIIWTGQTGIPIHHWGHDDRTGAHLHWVAPSEIVWATPIDTDGDKHVLFSVTVGDPEHGLYVERHTDHLINAALGAVVAITGGAASSEAEEPLPENKWGNNPPPQYPALAIWNWIADTTRVVLLPWSRGDTLWVPERNAWLMERILTTEDVYNENRSALLGRTLRRVYHLITREGGIHDLVDLALPAEADNMANRLITFRDPIVALSRVTPGELVICRSQTISGFDLLRNTTRWEMPNPFPAEAGPANIIPLSEQRVVAQVRSGGWVVIDSQGRIDPSDWWPANWYPSMVAGRCIVMGSTGMWRPLTSSTQL